MQAIIQRYIDQGGDAADLFVELFDIVRPEKPRMAFQAVHSIQALCHVLDHNPGYAEFVRSKLLFLLVQCKPVSLYVDSGIQPNTGFFTEMRRRIGHKFLPDAMDRAYLKDLFTLIFNQATDEEWVLAVPDEVWIDLIHSLRIEDAPPESLLQSRQGLLDALQVLSYRLAAAGLEQELVQNHPELEEHVSPFMMQQSELASLLKYPEDPAAQVDRIMVTLTLCREVIFKIRRNSARTGTSINLTFLLQGMSQQIMRMELLLTLVRRSSMNQKLDYYCIALFKTLVSAESHKNDVRQHWRQNMEILALRVTENASRTGEHYITTNRQEYFSLMRSAMGAGVAIVLMAMIKLTIAKHHLPPLTEAILFSLNYGFGFMLIHILHFTVATKQPAMTAAAIASSIDESDGNGRNLDKLVTIISYTMRSQVVAIFGNVVVAVPMAMMVASLYLWCSGHPFVDSDKANHLLQDIHPFRSGALLYAGIAGVCLFLSGLIAGYHDNIAIYNKIPQRIKALPWLQRLLGERRLERVADYIENNLGALAGNFYFGCLLGGMAAIGVLLGLPIDIRHIAFSSAFVGFSLAGLHFDVALETVMISASGVLLIGVVNLLVSFSLALYVAMKSRKLSFMQWPRLLKAVLVRINEHPREFLLIPHKEETPEVDSVN